MEEALDELISDCAHELFDLTDDKEIAKYPFNSNVWFWLQVLTYLVISTGSYHRYAVIVDNKFYGQIFCYLVYISLVP